MESVQSLCSEYSLFDDEEEKNFYGPQDGGYYFRRYKNSKFSSDIEKYALYPIVTKQEILEDGATSNGNGGGTMQKVPSLSDLSDPDSSLDMPTQVPPLTPGTNKKMTEALKASFASWEKEQIRLNITKDPKEWSETQVAHWLCWAVREFSLEGVPTQQFYMKGKDICAMGREAFLARAPPFMGDILWEHLEILQKEVEKEKSRSLESVPANLYDSVCVPDLSQYLVNYTSQQQQQHHHHHQSSTSNVAHHHDGDATSANKEHVLDNRNTTDKISTSPMVTVTNTGTTCNSSVVENGNSNDSSNGEDYKDRNGSKGLTVICSSSTVLRHTSANGPPSSSSSSTSPSGSSTASTTPSPPSFIQERLIIRN